MNITKKIIITDTNIITDLNNAKLLDKFVSLNNVYISDMVKNDEINYKTGNLDIIKKFNVIESSSEQLERICQLSKVEKRLSSYDLINYVIAKDNNYVLATGDDRLKKYAESNGVTVIRTIKIIHLMYEYKVITIQETINAYKLLLKNDTTRIPKNLLIDELKNIDVIEIN